MNPYDLGGVMRGTELYQNLLGIVSLWSVEAVRMDVEKQLVDGNCQAICRIYLDSSSFNF